LVGGETRSGKRIRRGTWTGQWGGQKNCKKGEKGYSTERGRDPRRSAGKELSPWAPQEKLRGGRAARVELSKRITGNLALGSVAAWLHVLRSGGYSAASERKRKGDPTQKKKKKPLYLREEELDATRVSIKENGGPYNERGVNPFSLGN